MKVLITRHETTAINLGKILSREGITTMREPLLKIVPKFEPISVKGFQALIVTSANGSIALAKGTDYRRIPVFAVGGATAAIAIEAGFIQVRNANGRVLTLTDIIISELNPEHGPLLYLSGENISVDIENILRAEKFKIHRQIVYRAVSAKALSASTMHALRKKNIDVVSFFSPRTAITFAKIIEKKGLREIFGSLTAVCLSEAVADPIRNLGWQEVLISETPDQESLVRSLCELRDRDRSADHD